MKTIWLAPIVIVGMLLSAFAQQKPTQPIRILSGALSRQGTHFVNSGRFLGWRFAARSRQDTSRWRRPNHLEEAQEQSEPIQATPDFAQLAPANFPNAGFRLRQTLPAGFIPTAVTNGDFNEDGHMDFAVSNGGDNTVYVFLGNGDGTFKVPEILYTQGQSPSWLTAAKLNNAGHLDLAVTDADSNLLEVFSGNGDGTFKTGVQMTLSQIPTFVVAADMNANGKTDLVVGLTIDQSKTQPQFEVLLGDGAGGFSGTITSPPTFGSPDGPVPTSWVAVGDMNNDGYPDVLTTAAGSGLAYLSKSGKSYSLGNSVSPPDGTFVVELGDMDEDGCLDAVQLSGYGFLNIGKGTCDGNFTEGAAIAEMGDIEPALKLADVNGDGHLDVIGSAAFYFVGGGGYGNEGGYLVSVLKGDGTGNVAPAQIYRGETNAFSLTVADFNGDNKPEIITADSLENRTSLFLNDGSGNYDGPQGEAIGYLLGTVNAPYPFGPTQAVDLNGDGKPDLLLIDIGAYSGIPEQLTAMLNNGTGKFLPAVRTPITIGDTFPAPLFVAGDFRNPGKADVVFADSYYPPFEVTFFPGNGDGSFAAPTLLATLPNPLKVVSGDFNQDGKLDFLVLGTDANIADWEFDVFLGRGDGTFMQLAAQTFPNFPQGIPPEQVMVADLNHDGKLDLLIGLNGNGGWVSSGDDLVEALGNGNGTFQAPKTLIANFGAVAVGDLNGDGYVDLVQKKDPTQDVGAQFYFTPAVTVYLGQANGTFQQQPTLTLGGSAAPSFDPVVLGDFNGDGILDIAYRYFVNPNGSLIEPRFRVLQGLGNGKFDVAGHVYQLQSVSDPFVGADFNGDGLADLVEVVGYTSSFHTIPGAAAPSLDIVIDSDPILGNSGTATVTLDLPASSTQTVTLTASDPAIQIPASVTFAAGQQTQSFNFTLGAGYDPSHIAALYATLGSQTAVAYGYKPNPNLTVGVMSTLLNGVYLLNQDFYAVGPGESFSLTLDLTSEGGYSGTFSSFQCIGLPANSSCSFASNSSDLLPGQTTGVNFTVNTSTSTPFGTYPVQIASTDGFFQASVTLTLGIGDFALNLNPAIVTMGPTGQVFPTVSSTATNGLNENITLTCSGLPNGASCGTSGLLSTNGGSTALTINGSQLKPQDYPFQITGQDNATSHTVNGTLRVGDFSSTLNQTAATLAPGQSATFNLTIDSINHYSNSITIGCQPTTTTVTCSASPNSITLADGGSTVITLIVSRPGSNATQLSSLRRTGFFLWLLPVSFAIVLRRRSNVFSSVLCLLILAGLVACGGGSGGTGNGGGNGGNPQPNTASIPVVVQAASSNSDFNNQKIVGPIVITLQ